MAHERPPGPLVMSHGAMQLIVASEVKQYAASGLALSWLAILFACMPITIAGVSALEQAAG